MIIIVRGPCSVGKTTTSYALAELLPDSACVAGDDWPWMSDRTMETFQERSKQSGYHFPNAWIAAGTAVVVEHGLHAIIDRFFTGDAELRNLLERLGKLNQQVHILNLCVDPGEHLQRDSRRPAEERIGQGGVEYFRTSDESGRSTLGVTIDTTGLTPQAVAQKILDRLNPDALR